MNTRIKRFIGAYVETERQGSDRASQALKPTPWAERYEIWKRTHLIDGYEMAVAKGPGTYSSIGHADTVLGEVSLILTAVRTATSPLAIEVSAGLDFDHNLAIDFWGRLVPAFHNASRIYSPPETAPAYRGTAEVRVKWDITGNKPDTKAFRVVPVPGRKESHLVFFETEVPASTAEGAVDRHEASLSGRATTFGTGSKMVLGIPWLHAARELVLEFPIEKVHTAVSELKALLTPPPAPKE